MNIQIIASGPENKKAVNILIVADLPLSVLQIKNAMNTWLDTLDEKEAKNESDD